MSEKARKRNVVVMVEELKGVAGSGLRGGRGMEGYGGTGVMEGTSQQGKQKKMAVWKCNIQLWVCVLERELRVKSCDSGRSQTASRL